MSGAKSEPNWLTLTQVRMLHAESLNIFGGESGIRDQGLLENALNRPRNKWLYEGNPSLFDLAAAYAFGIARNHSFIDGNKRTSFLAIRAFLFQNGYVFSPDEVESVTFIEGLAEGKVAEELLAAWIKTSSKKRR